MASLLLFVMLDYNMVVSLLRPCVVLLRMNRQQASQSFSCSCCAVRRPATLQLSRYSSATSQAYSRHPGTTTFVMHIGSLVSVSKKFAALPDEARAELLPQRRRKMNKPALFAVGGRSRSCSSDQEGMKYTRFPSLVLVLRQKKQHSR